MTFEQLKDKYNYHHDKLVELRHAYEFMKANLHEFFGDKEADGLMLMIQAAKYLAECIELERAAFGRINIILWGKWDTDNYDLDHEIYNLYDLAGAQESGAKELLNKINDICNEACQCYLFNYTNFTNEEKYDAMKKVLDYPKYLFKVPEKPKYTVISYPRKYFGHEEK